MENLLLKTKNRWFIRAVVAVFVINLSITLYFIGLIAENKRIANRLLAQRDLSDSFTARVVRIQVMAYDGNIEMEQLDTLQYETKQWVLNHNHITSVTKTYFSNIFFRNSEPEYRLTKGQESVQAIDMACSEFIMNPKPETADRALEAIYNNDRVYHQIILTVNNQFGIDLERKVSFLKILVVVLSFMGIGFMILGYRRLIVPTMINLSIAREEMRKAKDVSEAASKAKSDFLANMSHEIRTPLNGIIGFTDLLMNTQLSPNQKQYLETVSLSANNLMEIINDILDLAKIESGKMELSSEITDLATLIAQVMNVVSYQAQKKNVELVITMPPDMPRFVWADEVRLRQILVNLVGNAMKFTEEGEIELKVERRVGHFEANKIYFRFTVRDTGIGISPNAQQKIFEVFQQADAYTTKKYGGTGLGLNISNQLLGMMGSRLQLESTPGQGSKFYFEVAFAPAQTGKPVEQGEKFVAKKNGVSFTNVTGKVLLVEDNPINKSLARILMKGMLPAATLLEAENGEQAVDMFTKENPVLIFMDVQMPVMNGYEATQRIRQIEKENSRGSRTAIIALTAGAIAGEREACLEAGMDGFVSKPINTGALQQAIAQVLQQSATGSV